MTSEDTPSAVDDRLIATQALTALTEHIVRITDEKSDPRDVAHDMFMEGAWFFPSREVGRSPFEQWARIVVPELEHVHIGGPERIAGRVVVTLQWGARGPLRSFDIDPLIAVLENAYDNGTLYEYSPFVVDTDDENIDWYEKNQTARQAVA